MYHDVVKDEGIRKKSTSTRCQHLKKIIIIKSCIISVQQIYNAEGILNRDKWQAGSVKCYKTAWLFMDHPKDLFYLIAQMYILDDTFNWFMTAKWLLLAFLVMTKISNPRSYHINLMPNINPMYSLDTKNYTV